MAELVVENLVMSFGSVAAVSDVSFTIEEGEFLTLLGPSGCGKSTTLAAIAGLDAPTSGLIRSGSTIFFDGASGFFLPPEKRNCGLVFQSYALWPHLTVQQNLAFPLKLRRRPKREQAQMIDAALSLVEMQAYQHRYPHELSGGQQQRVALARTLVYEPSVLLLDEPLSNLDAKLRERARTWLDELRRRVRRTTLYVTHDQQEALVLSDRIAVMNQGRIVQIGTPREIYETPSNPFVADFIGTSSFLKGSLKDLPNSDGFVAVEFVGGTRILATLARPQEEFRADQAVVAALRPERLSVLPSPDRRPAEPGTVVACRSTTRSYLGARWQCHLALGGSTVKIETGEPLGDGTVHLWIPAGGCLVFAAT